MSIQLEINHDTQVSGKQEYFLSMALVLESVPVTFIYPWY